MRPRRKLAFVASFGEEFTTAVVVGDSGNNLAARDYEPLVRVCCDTLDRENTIPGCKPRVPLRKEWVARVRLWVARVQNHIEPPPEHLRALHSELRRSPAEPLAVANRGEPYFWLHLKAPDSNPLVGERNCQRS